MGYWYDDADDDDDWCTCSAALEELCQAVKAIGRLDLFVPIPGFGFRVFRV